jgi:transposase-like protein
MQAERPEAKAAREREWICARCKCALKPKKTVFKYLERSFTHEVPCCPSCGRVFIPQTLAEGRMAEVERMLEDK